VIEAIGRAQLDVNPDRAYFSVTFREIAGQAGDAAAAAADRARLATAAMRQRGGPGLEVRSRVSVEPIYQEYRDRDGVRISSDRADQIANYVAAVQLEVEVADVARAADVRAAALAVGPEDSGELRYSLRETGELQRRAYAAAVEDAALRARAAAAAAGARLGGLMALQEGQGPCLGSWYGSRPGYAAQPPPPPPPPPADTAQQVVVTGSRGRALTLSADQIQRMQLASDPDRVTLSAQVCAVYAIAQ
jgi:uncharacterized protein YggE